MRTKKNKGLNLKNEYSEGKTLVPHRKTNQEKAILDSSDFATLIARVWTTFLNGPTRRQLRDITIKTILDNKTSDAPKVDDISSWYHPKTLIELGKIQSYITKIRNPEKKQFLTLCFSSIQTSCTGRRGKQHGFFADNTPLAKGDNKPPYQNAIELLIERVHKNLLIIERFYSFIEHAGRNPLVELQRARVCQVNSTSADVSEYEVNPGSVAGIITSPPYLCMADYTLGQRLSYYWLSSENMTLDLENELGARRKRTSPDRAVKDYYDGLRNNSSNMATLLRSGGFMSTIVGAPVAKSFEDLNILDHYDEIMEQVGLRKIWSNWRNIHWHRQHGYARLKQERIAVYRKE